MRQRSRNSNGVDDDPLNSRFPVASKAPTVSGMSHWLGHLKVGQKITLGYTLVLSAAVLGTAIGFMIADQYQQEAQEKSPKFLERSVERSLQKLDDAIAHSATACCETVTSLSFRTLLALP